ncbi:MAG: hypothetical protein AUH41_09540 [Gemmatimonadetes bacterium 13_1_40CM_66_11]|nr:MAG: hypothetical protein AUH41_09540 [Gemmatimonadetes bacterium 13_1_40CM_66_11]
MPSRLNHPVLLPPDEADLEDEAMLPAAAAPAPPTAVRDGTAPKLRWYTYVASGLAGAVLVTAIYGLLGSRSGSFGIQAGSGTAPGGVPVSDTALLDRRADTLALAISAFNMRAGMYDSRRMPCSGLARGLTQVEDAWLGYNIARKDLLAGTDRARDARDKRLYADVRGVEVKFERASCARP